MDGNRLCGIITQTDIFRTIKKKLQEDEEENFRRIANSENCIYTLNIDGTVNYINAAFLKLFEIDDIDEIINAPFLPERFWVNPEERKKFLEELDAESVELRELSLNTATGKRIYVTVFFSVTQDVHGQRDGSQGIIYDITPKKELVVLRETQQALKESEERYKRISSAVTDYIFTVVFKSGKPVETIHSNASVAVTGYTSDELNSDPNLWINMVHPQDRTMVCEQVTKCMLGREIEPLEHRIVRKDGIMRWVKSTLVRHYDKSGVLLSYDGLLKDITERKEAENELLESQRQQKAILNSVPDLAWLKDMDGRYIAVNEPFENACGFKCEDLIGLTDQDIWPGDLARKYIADDKDVMRLGKRRMFEELLASKNHQDKRIWIETIKTPIYSSSGKVIGISGIAREVTERKRAQETLRLTQFAVDHASDAAFWIGPDGKILYANEVASRHLGFTREELLAKTIHEIDPDFPALKWPEHWSEVKKNKSLVFESHHKAKDGQVFPVEVHANYACFEGKEYNFAFVRDITDRKRWEKACMRVKRSSEG